MDLVQKYTLKSSIDKSDILASTTPDETLGTVLSLVNSSHEPILVYTKDNEYKGVVSPYQTLYKKRLPYTTKVESIIFQTPKITFDTPLYDVARFMLETRLYKLPVFKKEHDEKIEGIIDAKKMVRSLMGDPDFSAYGESVFGLQIPITAPYQSTVGEIYSLMRDEGISRVLLLNEEGGIVGIVTRRDLFDTFAKPTPKQRFGKNGFRPTDWAFEGEKKYRNDMLIQEYAKNSVSTTQKTSPKEIIEELLNSEFNSIIIVDTNQRPKGILTMRDVISLIADLKPEEDINIILHKPSDSVTEPEYKAMLDHVTKFAQKMNRRIAIEKVEINFEEPKYANGETAEFNALVKITPIRGESFIAKTKRPTLLESIQAATSQIQKQIRRSALTRKETEQGVEVASIA